MEIRELLKINVQTSRRIKPIGELSKKERYTLMSILIEENLALRIELASLREGTNAKMS